MTSISWTTALQTLRSAVDNLLIGDPVPYQQLWSSAADVTMMGAYGGLDTGYDAVCAAITRAAANYRGWQPDYQEEALAAQYQGKFGYVILRESVTNRVDSTVRRRRVTVLLRLEAGQWRVFHHHSDPLHQAES